MNLVQDNELCESRLVGPVGFEPTASGPDLLGVTSAPGSPSITGLWYPLGGVNPLDQARRRPLLLRIKSTGILPFRRVEDPCRNSSGFWNDLRDKAMRADRSPDSWKRPPQQRQRDALLSNGIFRNPQ